MLQLNVSECPKSVLAAESLAQPYRRQRNKAKAIEAYEKALALDRRNLRAALLVKQLRGKRRET